MGKGNGKDDNPDKPFWEVRSDLNSLAAVVRRWLTRHQRWTSPVFLVGESYGGLRAAALGRVLARDVGVAVSGFVLVSPALDIDAAAPRHQQCAGAGPAAAELRRDRRRLRRKPRRSSAAQEAERFALTDYLAGLAALTGIPEPGDPLIERIAALIGLPAETVRRERGRVDPRTFARELRRPERRDPEPL